MGKFLKSWWIWAVAALAIVAFVVFLAPARHAVFEPTLQQGEADSPEGTALPLEVLAPEPEPEPNAAREIASALGQPPAESAAVPSPRAESAVVAGEISTSIAATPPHATAPEIIDQLLQVETPEVEAAVSGAPSALRAPALGARPPLSLAQVLLPGDAPEPNQVSPSFDLVRVAPDGSAVIAGRAAPGAHVQVFSGSVPVAEATASSRGEFVVFLNAPGDSAQALQGPATPEGAALVVSQDDIVILPVAPNADGANPIVVRRTPDTVEIVQPSGLATPGHVSLDLVSYSDTGAVQLAGRGKPGNTARIYADGQLAGETSIAASGNWDLEIQDIDEGRYVLRIDEIDGQGAVLSRAESPFQREFPEATHPGSFMPGAKAIVQPGNTLWLMATEAYGDGGAYTQIFSANDDAIRDPNLIYPGQIFNIPRAEE